MGEAFCLESRFHLTYKQSFMEHHGLGYLNFILTDAFADPQKGIQRPRNSIWDLLEPPSPEKVCEWPRITKANHFQGAYLIEAESGTHSISIRFNPDQPESGCYSIQKRPRGSREDGTTLAVTTVDDEMLRFPRYSPLKGFPVRYALRTVRNVRPHDCMIWRVALNHVNEIVLD